MDFERSVVVPEGVAPPRGAYSHAVVASGRLLFVSGQVAFDEDGELVGIGDPTAQARQVFTNLQRVIESAGGRMEDVARITLYLTDPSYRAAVAEIRGEFFPTSPPSAVLLVVSALALPEFLVEVDAMVPLRD